MAKKKREASKAASQANEPGRETWFSRRAKQLRRDRNIGISELSRITGIDKGIWSRMESGESEPSLKTLRQIAAGLGISVSEILREEESEPAEKVIESNSFKLGLLNHIATLKKSLQEAEELLKRIESGTNSTGLSELEKTITGGRKVDLSED